MLKTNKHLYRERQREDSEKTQNVLFLVELLLFEVVGRFRYG